jgi:type I restriction enzyme, S subunit
MKIPRGWAEVRLKDLNIKRFKGINTEKVSVGDNYLLPSGSVFPDRIKIEKCNQILSSNISNKEKLKKLTKGDVLFNTGGVGTLGRVGYFKSKNFDRDCYSDAFVLVIRNDDKRLKSKFLFYWLRTPQINIEIQRFTVGSTGITSIKSSDIMNFSIPLPPISVQEKIIELLEKAEQIKEWRKEADELSKDYLKSVFVDMFGDPINNNKKFNMKALGKLCDFSSGGTPSRKKPEYFQGDIPWITTVALGPRYINKSSAVELITPEAVKGSATRIIPKNSLLVGVRVGVGKVSINECEMCTSQDILALTNIDKSMTNEFIYSVLGFFVSYFDSQQRGATIKGITSSTLKEIKMIMPSKDEQDKFSEIVHKFEKLKENQINSKQESNDLFNSLMQKAFKGELV